MSLKTIDEVCGVPAGSFQKSLKEDPYLFKYIESGFEDIPKDMQPVCSNLSHNPPNSLCVPEGKRYRHVCLECGHVQYIYSSISYS